MWSIHVPVYKKASVYLGVISPNYTLTRAMTKTLKGFCSVGSTFRQCNFSWWSFSHYHFPAEIHSIIIQLKQRQELGLGFRALWTEKLGSNNWQRATLENWGVVGWWKPKTESSGVPWRASRGLWDTLGTDARVLSVLRSIKAHRY